MVQAENPFKTRARSNNIQKEKEEQEIRALMLTQLRNQTENNSSNKATEKHVQPHPACEGELDSFGQLCLAFNTLYGKEKVSGSTSGIKFDDHVGRPLGLNQAKSNPVSQGQTLHGECGQLCQAPHL